MNYDILTAFVLATGALAITPGPDNIFVMVQSIVHGKKYGLATVAGLMSGCLVHTTLLALGASAILKENETLFLVVKLFGAGYLLYLAFKVYASEAKIKLADSSTAKKSVWGLFKTGFLMNVLNPKVTLFFLALFPGFLFSDAMGRVAQFYVLGFLFIAVSFLIFGSIALMAGQLKGFITKNQHAAVFFKWMQIFVFLAIAVYLLLSDK
ncbi:Hypothetical protein I595_2138 [Croceitalea dokdonensis DOKDO 023]|uniref:Uncharacterized protein n=1 Tax=Croceitalea dokdonensis DOKDO 023 TaxID=1300341 RepID=A0A0N8H3V7_9FLAO|nr:LysE family translocator [Croceitalea dokdonensis]KPM31644.1 Hypothetical protein I595_2138 [Croceitalea dokdonensis DOKDO 023]